MAFEIIKNTSNDGKYHLEIFTDDLYSYHVLQFLACFCKSRESRVEVVRCENCKHSREPDKYERNYVTDDIVICTNPDATDDGWAAVLKDHFCSCGERRCDE